MKKLVIFITIAVIVCFTATFIGAQDNTAIQQTTQTAQANASCRLSFSQVLNSKEDKSLKMFEDRVEYFLEEGFFWEACLMENLQNKKNITVHYIGYTEGQQPTKTELKRLIKSAMEFKDELESYIENQEPKSSPLHHAEKYIVLKTDPALMLDKHCHRMLKKENKHFKANSDMGKIFIHIKTEQNTQSVGTVVVEAHN